MRSILLLIALVALPLVAADPAKIEPTVPDRIQAFIDPTTGKVERLEIYDANSIVDSVGNTFKTPLRLTVINRSDVPALFAALDALLAKTSERDAAARAKKAADDAARAAQPKP